MPSPSWKRITSPGWRLALLASSALLTCPPVAQAQESVTAVILRGASVADSIAQRGPTLLAPGLRVQSPAGSWTELAFSDGSSIVLEASADFTLRSVSRSREGRLVIRGVSGRGRLRVTAANGTDVAIMTGSAEILVADASAIVALGEHGSATMTSGGRVTVRRADGGSGTLRRAGFLLGFDDVAPQRQTRTQLAAAAAPFAPVQYAGTTPGAGQAGGGALAVTSEDPTIAQASQRRTDTLAVAGLIGREPTPGPAGNASAGQNPIVQNPVGQNPIGQSPTGQNPVDQTPIVQNPTNPNPPTNPTVPTPPDDPPPPPRGNSFSLALANLSGTPSAGSYFAGPGANSTVSSIDSKSFLSTSGQEGQAITEVPQVVSQGTARVRRFASTGSDFGTVAPPPSALATGQPVQGTGSQYFANLTRATLGTGAGQTFYDAVANLGVVTLGVQTSSTNNFVDYVPRVYLADQNAPSITRVEAPVFQVTGNPGTAREAPLTTRDRINIFTQAQVDALGAAAGNILLSVTLIPVNIQPPSDQPRVDLFLLQRYNPGTVSYTQVGNNLTQGQLSQAIASIVNNNQSATVLLAQLQQSRDGGGALPAIVYRAGAVLELELQQRSATPTNLPPPATGSAGRRGTVFALSGDRGQVIYVAGAGNYPLPGVASPDLNNGVRATPPNPPAGDAIPDVFIIDKITASSDAIFNQRGIAAGNATSSSAAAVLPRPWAVACPA